MFYEIDQDGYVTEFGKGDPKEGSYEISEERYNALAQSFAKCPICEEGFMARLNMNVEWEIVKVEPTEEVDEAEDKAEAYDILMGENL